jgi:hypothetical protein
MPHPATLNQHINTYLAIPERLMTLAALREELAGLEFLIARELERDVIEGAAHTGRVAVVQILARRR